MPFTQDCGFFVDTMKNNEKLQTLFVFLPELSHSAHSLGSWGGFTYLNHLVNWFYMLLLLPFHSIFLSPLNLDPLGRHFILAYYSSFHMTGGLSNLFNDSLIPLNQSYLCNSGRDWNVSLSMSPSSACLWKRKARVDRFSHLPVVWIKPPIWEGRSGNSWYGF